MKYLITLASISGLLFLAGASHTFAETTTQAAQIGAPVATFVERLRLEQAERREDFIQRTAPKADLVGAPLNSTTTEAATTTTAPLVHVRRAPRADTVIHPTILQFDNATRQLYALADRLASQATLITERGLDASSATTLITSAYASLDATEDFVSEAETILNVPTPAPEALAAARPILKNAQDSLQSSRQDLIKAVAALRDTLANAKKS